jgi:hypothetical protein
MCQKYFYHIFRPQKNEPRFIDTPCLTNPVFNAEQYQDLLRIELGRMQSEQIVTSELISRAECMFHGVPTLRREHVEQCFNEIVPSLTPRDREDPKIGQCFLNLFSRTCLTQ